MSNQLGSWPACGDVTFWANADLLPALGSFWFASRWATAALHGQRPLAGRDADAVKNDLVVSAVLSGKSQLEGRINLAVRANYLASRCLVVAFAIAVLSISIR